MDKKLSVLILIVILFSSTKYKLFVYKAVNFHWDV